MAGPEKAEQRYGVVDGPCGHAWVVVPADRAAARLLNTAHGRRFWCSTLAGGCGAQLSLHIGEEKAPHFSHYPGQTKDCPFAYDSEALERSYLHLALQYALKQWLAEQGFTAALEHTLPDGGGRADLHVRVEPGEQTIEVQLSSLRSNTWEARNDRYTRHVDRVTWLFGPHAGQHVLTAATRRYGYALAVKLTSQQADAADPATIQIGTVTRSGTQWVALTACTMTPTGIVTPHVAAALAEHETWRARAATVEERPRDSVDADARPSGGGRPLRDHTTFREPEHPPLAPTPATLRPRTPVRMTPKARGTGQFPLTSDLWPDPDHWPPPIGWGFLDALPPELHRAAKLLTYYVTRESISSPDWKLSLPELEDDGAIQAVLEQAGLIELYDTPSGIRRWQRKP